MLIMYNIRQVNMADHRMMAYGLSSNDSGFYLDVFYSRFTFEYLNQETTRLTDALIRKYEN